jgi:hypothetical protein
MIDHQQKGSKKAGSVKVSGVREISQAKKTRVSDGSDMIINPELDKYAGDEFVPEKYNEDGIRLANSILPNSKSSLK